MDQKKPLYSDQENERNDSTPSKNSIIADKQTCSESLNDPPSINLKDEIQGISDIEEVSSVDPKQIKEQRQKERLNICKEIINTEIDFLKSQMKTQHYINSFLMKNPKAKKRSSLKQEIITFFEETQKYLASSIKATKTFIEKLTGKNIDLKKIFSSKWTYKEEMRDEVIQCGVNAYDIEFANYYDGNDFLHISIQSSKWHVLSEQERNNIPILPTNL